MCAIGRYANVNQRTQKANTAANFMRSANEPTIKAQVIPANVAWNAMKMYSGIFTLSVKVSASESGVTPNKKALLRSAINKPSPPKASE